MRIEKEYAKYNYNPYQNSKYKFIGGDKEYHFRHNIMMRENIDYLETKNFLGLKSTSTKCVSVPPETTSSPLSSITSESILELSTTDFMYVLNSG